MKYTPIAVSLFYGLLVTLLALATSQEIYYDELGTRDCDGGYYCRAYLSLVKTDAGLDIKVGYKVYTAGGPPTVPESTRKRILDNTDEEIMRWTHFFLEKTGCLLAPDYMVATALKDSAHVMGTTCHSIPCDHSVTLDYCSPGMMRTGVGFARQAGPSHYERFPSANSIHSTYERTQYRASGFSRQPNAGYYNPHPLRQY